MLMRKSLVAAVIMISTTVLFAADGITVINGKVTCTGRCTHTVSNGVYTVCDSHGACYSTPVDKMPQKESSPVGPQ